MGKKSPFEAEEILEFADDAAHVSEGASDTTKAPVRTCIVTRERHGTPNLLRFVLSPQNEVVPDIKAHLPGRGVWIGSKQTTIETAVRKRAFNRAFKKDVSVPLNLAAKTAGMLRTAALQRLSLANKAGLVVTGFTRLSEALRKREIVFVLHADTAAEDGVAKLNRIFIAASGGSNACAFENRLTADEISLAAGKSNVIHAGLKEGGASLAFLQALERFNGYSATGDRVGPVRQGRE